MFIQYSNRSLWATISLMSILGIMMITACSLAATPKGVTAICASDFLDSIGVNSSISTRGENLSKMIECTRYLGVRWFRTGTEGDIPMHDLIALHRQTGARYSWGLLSGGTDIAKLCGTGRELAKAGALLAFEGLNEPNNWGITYQGETGGRDKSWLPVARLQRDLYKAVKSTLL